MKVLKSDNKVIGGVNKIKGIMKDNNDNPLRRVHIGLYRAKKNSEILTQVKITNDNGEYFFNNVKLGKYIIKVYSKDINNQEINIKREQICRKNEIKKEEKNLIKRKKKYLKKKKENISKKREHFDRWKKVQYKRKKKRLKLKKGISKNE